MNAEVYNQYVKEYADNIYRYILKNTRNTADAEDIVQVTFQRLWENRDKIDEERIKSWLFTTAHNRMIDVFRKRKPETPIMPLHQPSTNSGERSIDLKDLIDQALRHLTGVQRQVVLLRDYEGYSYTDIAEITGLSDSQVKVYIFRARKKLKEVILSMEDGKSIAQLQ